LLTPYFNLKEKDTLQSSLSLLHAFVQGMLVLRMIRYGEIITLNFLGERLRSRMKANIISEEDDSDVILRKIDFD